MKNIIFEGVYSATFSLYDEALHVKKQSVAKLLEYNLKNGIKGFYVGGNTGECMVLPNKTRKQMLETVKEYAPADAQIMVHVGAGHLDDVVDLVEHAAGVGVDAISSLPPSLTSYYKPGEIVEYYRYLASISKVPVLSYVTSVLNCDVVWFARQIMSIDNIIGLKVSIPNYYAFEQIKTVNGGDINVLNGPDESMLSGLAMGADGAVGLTYNLFPAVACGIYDSYQKGDCKEALQYQHKLNRFIDIMLANRQSMATWKSVLELLDIDPGYTVFPASMPSKEQTADLFSKLKAAGCVDFLK